ncbi:hypothetical protein NFI96_030781 [Prochilodus magdalenae]|nr:hypothetical protein NFI96_030781 [Prochilodus magdalenae]
MGALEPYNHSSDVERAEIPKHAAEPSACDGQRGVILAGQYDSSDVERAEIPKHAAEPSASTASDGQRGVNLAVHNDSSDVGTAEITEHAAEPSGSSTSDGLRGVILAVQNDSSDLETAKITEQAGEPSSSASDGQRGVILAGQISSDVDESSDCSQHNNSKEDYDPHLDDFIPCSYDVEEEVPGRLLKVRACFENEVLVFICVYAPTVGTERLAFLDTLHSVVQNSDVNDLLVLGGDFNCTADDIDRSHMEPHPASRRRLRELVVENELCDVWRTLHVEQRQCTWTHCKDHMLSLTRLDRLCV